MTKTKLEDVGKDLGLDSESKDQPKGPGGRPLGEDIGQPNLKKMTKEALKREAGKLRKENKDLNDKLSAATSQLQPEAEQIPPELWGAIPAMTYDYLAMRFGDHWRLQEPEMILYGKSIARVADRYLGEVAGDKPELVGLIITATIITLPRAFLTVRDKLKEKNESEGPEETTLQ